MAGAILPAVLPTLASYALSGVSALIGARREKRQQQRALAEALAASRRAVQEAEAEAEKAISGRTVEAQLARRAAERRIEDAKQRLASELAKRNLLGTPLEAARQRGFEEERRGTLDALAATISQLAQGPVERARQLRAGLGATEAALALTPRVMGPEEVLPKFLQESVAPAIPGIFELLRQKRRGLEEQRELGRRREEKIRGLESFRFERGVK